MDPEHLIGSTVRGWTLERVLGKGADGVVFVGFQNGTQAAVKVFFPENLAKPAWAGARDRLDIQLSLIGKKHHPNLVEVLEGGELPELATLYLVMELIPGTSLDRLCGKIPPENVASLVKQLAAAAEHLEKLEMVHRDIKPANVVISEDFKVLTLLDFGVVHQIPSDDEDGRLSGREFVATTRYSPPEFVWRKEEADLEHAWRAVTFYQIGATLHDMIMGKCIFEGHDTPHACLYDSIKELTPTIGSDHVEKWLIHLAQACLLKDWRQRVLFLDWPSFSGPGTEHTTYDQEKRIRLKQLRSDEMRISEEKKRVQPSGRAREQELWALSQALSTELRNYVLSSSIYPKPQITERRHSNSEYSIEISLEVDPAKSFQEELTFQVAVAIDDSVNSATRVTFNAVTSAGPISSSTWIELFTVESAFQVCKQGFLDAVEQIMDQ